LVRVRGVCGRTPEQISVLPLTNHINTEDNNTKKDMNAKERFLEYYYKAKKKGTAKSYRRGLEFFLEWYLEG
jgi:hypothetical protein